MGKYDYHVFYDKPIPYKDWLLYPVGMRQYLEFMQVSQILLLDIYSIPDPSILSMKYLEYLFYVKDEDGKYVYLPFLYHLLTMVFNLGEMDKVNFFEDGKYFTIEKKNVDGKKTDSKKFDKEDFETIKEIIIEQNLLTPPNHRIEKALRDSMEEARSIRAKRDGNSKQASVEDQMVALMIATGISMDNIYDMTIRKFSKALERVDHTMHYKIYLAASYNGMVKFKDKNFVKHWLVDLTKDEFEGLLPYETVEKTVTSGNM